MNEEWLTVLQVNMRYSSIVESDFAISVNVAQFYIATVSYFVIDKLTVLDLLNSFALMLFNYFAGFIC